MNRPAMVRLFNGKNYLVESLENCKLILEVDQPDLKLKKGDAFTIIHSLYDENGDDLLVVRGYIKIFKLRPEYLTLILKN